jgi:hypothetical protein
VDRKASLVVVWLAACAAPAAPAAPARRTATPGPGGATTAAEHLAGMKASLREILERVADARAEKDVVKLNCLSEKLSHMKALLEVAEQSSAALRETGAAKDAGAEWELSEIGIARTRMELLRAESERCIGQLAHRVDEKAAVEVVKPPSR